MPIDPPFDFDAIRPYYDSEVPEVLLRLSQKASFPILMQYLFPEQSTEQIVEDVRHIKSTHEFQAKYIHGAIRGIVSQSTNGLSFEGMDTLQAARPCLFISNHRDIILDSAFLNILLFEHKLPTSQIAIGDNLMVSGLVTDLMKVNKSFIVHRAPTPSELRFYSLRLSNYIRETVTQNRDSVWLAQRNGRTKNGHDQTQGSLLKMLCMSSDASLPTALAELRIRPMAISFEFEPCAGLKAEELVHQELGLPYEKDDKQAMITGIRAPKGRVHLAIGPLLSDEMASLPDHIHRKEQVAAATALIDQHVYRLFKCWPTHFVAADMLEGGNKRATQYTATEQEAFHAYLEAELSQLKGPREALYQKILEIYGNPVLNAERCMAQN